MQASEAKPLPDQGDPVQHAAPLPSGSSHIECLLALESKVDSQSEPYSPVVKIQTQNPHTLHLQTEKDETIICDLNGSPVD
jgi:hypothetical protein